MVKAVDKKGSKGAKAAKAARPTSSPSKDRQTAGARAAPPRSYPDLRDHLAALDAAEAVVVEDEDEDADEEAAVVPGPQAVPKVAASRPVASLHSSRL